MQTEITGTDTWNHFALSGALSYGWYDVESHRPECDDWILRFRDATCPEDQRVYVLDHKRVMIAVHKCARAFIRHREGTPRPKFAQYVHVETMRQCCLFLADPDCADFDADTADQVLQVAAFGKVVYG